MEEGGNRWKNMDISGPGLDVSCQPPKKTTLWQASTENQLRNIGTPSFVTAKVD
jgi:hypothetical protein